MAAVAYKDSNGVAKFGVIKEVDDKLNRYYVSPFSTDKKAWVFKDHVIQPDSLDLDEDFIRIKLESAINVPDGRICGISSSGSSPVDKRWKIGRVCVCQWCGDNQWYFAIITAIFPETRTCDVRFFYYNNSQCSVSLDRLHPVTSKTISRVKDPLNIGHAYEFLTAANWPVSRNDSSKESENEGHHEEKSIKKENREAGKNKRHNPEASWSYRLGCNAEERLSVSEISRFWLSLLARKCESEKVSIRKLILKHYKLGYDVGFKMVMKTKQFLKD